MIGHAVFGLAWWQFGQRTLTCYGAAHLFYSVVSLQKTFIQEEKIWELRGARRRRTSDARVAGGWWHTNAPLLYLLLSVLLATT